MFKYFELPLEIRILILEYCRSNIVNILILDEELCMYCFKSEWLYNNLEMKSKNVKLADNKYLEDYFVIKDTNIKHSLYIRRENRKQLYLERNYFLGTKNGLQYKKKRNKKITKLYRFNKLVYRK